MKKIIIPIAIAIVFFLFACMGGLNSIFSAYDFNTNFLQLNFPKDDPEFKLPKNWSIAYNKSTKDYVLCFRDDLDMPDFITYLRIFRGVPFVLDMWSTSSIENAEKFSDSSKLKAYARMYYNKQTEKTKENLYKPVTTK